MTPLESLFSLPVLLLEASEAFSFRPSFLSLAHSRDLLSELVVVTAVLQDNG